MKRKRTCSELIYEEARRNPCFIRFLKEHNAFKEFFTNIKLYPFTYTKYGIDEEDYINSAFSWESTGDFYKWEELNNEWISEVFKHLIGQPPP